MQHNLKNNQDDVWPFICSVIYTFVWSVSFWGQAYENYKLKSVEGFSMNYLTLNITGYSLYTIYLSAGYFTHLSGAGTVVIADIIFVYHAMFFIIVHSIQAVIYPKGANRLSSWVVVVIIIIWIIVILEYFITIMGWISWSQYWNPISFLGYCKLSLAVFKCTPQIYWNYTRKSTQGWSIFMIIMDLIGGIFSFASGGLSVEDGLNITKLALAILSIIYDLIFVAQHYCWFKKKNISVISIDQSDKYESIQ